MNDKTSALKEVGMVLKENLRNYAMYIALAVIFILFYILSNGAFLTARNITNLINQTGYVAVMAVGMTLILILRQIDLSIGYLAGLCGACAAVLLKNGYSVAVVIPIVLAIGMFAGFVQGTIIGWLGVPAFVTTLACQFIFRGLQILTTEATGTIPIGNDTFSRISNGFVPSLFRVEGRHGSALLIGALVILIVIIAQIRERRDLKRYNFYTAPLPLFIFSLLFFSALIGSFTYILSGFNGISWTIVVVVVIALVYNFILNRTRFGRYVYGAGGNREAATLAGIDVKRMIVITFSSMGLMAAMGGILFTSRLQSATPTAGAGFELDAIAACFIGGVSTTGGVGRVINSIIGAFVIMSLTNGMNLIGIGISYQYIIKGGIFIIAVAFDVFSQGNQTV